FAAALKKFEAEQLPGRLAEWEKTAAARPDRFKWVILDMVSFRSQGGATLTKLEDGSLRAGGQNPPLEAYRFVAHTDLPGITSVRLEALADESLVRGGPGRAGNGNFALSDFRLSIAPKASGGRKPPGAKPVAVRLRNSRATFEQKGLPVKAAIDNDQK